MYTVWFMKIILSDNYTIFKEMDLLTSPKTEALHSTYIGSKMTGRDLIFIATQHILVAQSEDMSRVSPDIAGAAGKFQRRGLTLLDTTTFFLSLCVGY